MDAKKFKNVVQKIVSEELNKMIRPMIKEVMAEMLLEINMSGARGTNVQGIDNREKAKALRESSYLDADEMDEYPTLGDGIIDMKTKYANLMGGFGQPSEIGLDKMMTENGTPVPVDPSSIPDAVRKAMNRNYSEIIAAWNK